MFKNYYLSLSFGISLILIIVAFSLFYIHLADIQHLIIIHFESLKGVDFLGNKGDVIGILITGLILNILNFLLASFYYTRNRLYSYLISLINIFISLLILITIIVIISVN